MPAIGQDAGQLIGERYQEDDSAELSKIQLVDKYMAD